MLPVQPDWQSHRPIAHAPWPEHAPSSPHFESTFNGSIALPNGFHATPLAGVGAKKRVKAMDRIAIDDLLRRRSQNVRNRLLAAARRSLRTIKKQKTKFRNVTDVKVHLLLFLCGCIEGVDRLQQARRVSPATAQARSGAAGALPFFPHCPCSQAPACQLSSLQF